MPRVLEEILSRLSALDVSAPGSLGGDLVVETLVSLLILGGGVFLPLGDAGRLSGVEDRVSNSEVTRAGIDIRWFEFERSPAGDDDLELTPELALDK